MRRHALTDTELQLIREGLARLAREAQQAQQAPHMTPEGRRRLSVHLHSITALSERLQSTQTGRSYPGYQADRARQRARRFQASLATRARRAGVRTLRHIVNPTLRDVLGPA